MKNHQDNNKIQLMSKTTVISFYSFISLFIVCSKMKHFKTFFFLTLVHVCPMWVVIGVGCLHCGTERLKWDINCKKKKKKGGNVQCPLRFDERTQRDLFLKFDKSLRKKLKWQQLLVCKSQHFRHTLQILNTTFPRLQMSQIISWPFTKEVLHWPQIQQETERKCV